MPTVLVLAGLDPSGGAGLIADVATVAARGLHPAGIATALTLQDSRSCRSVEAIAPELVRRQIELLVEDVAIAAVKVGMVGTAAMAAAVASALAPLVAAGVPVVVDPLLRASRGVALLDGEPVAALAPLLGIATLLTPNRDEASCLAGLPIDDALGQARAASILRGRGPRAVLVKGGHLPGDDVADVLDDGAPLWYVSARRPGETPHGTGCALSTEIACNLALGLPLREAVAEAHLRLSRRITAARPVGGGRPFLPFLLDG